MQTKENFYNTLTSEGGAWKIAKDTLQETAALRRIIKACENRLEEIKPKAIALAEKDLKKLGQTSGRFEHLKQTFELGITPVFEFVSRPQKYTMPEGVEYRELAAQQDELRKQTQAKTKQMSTVATNFRTAHPNIAPDDIKKVLKFIDD